MGDWRNMNTAEQLNHLYSSPKMFMVIKLNWMRWSGHSARGRDEKYYIQYFVGNLEGKRLVARSKCRWGDNIGIRGRWK
jgi:hypothetical protein